MKPRHRLILIAVTALILVAVSVSGCMNSTLGGEQKSTPSSGYDTGYGYETPAAAPDYYGSSGSSGYYYGKPTVAPDAYSDVGNRKVIMTAYVQVETTKFEEAVTRVRALASEAGGYVQSSSLDVFDDKRQTCTITLKVPQAKFESTLTEVRKLGTVKADRSTGSDVTGTYMDLQARLKNAKSSEERLLAIMDDANTTSDVLEVERELSRVRGEIESMTAQLNTLTNQVDFATITVYVTEPTPVVAYDWGIGDAFSEAVHVFVGMIGALIILTGFLLPLAIYVLICLAVLYLLIRGILWLYQWSKARKQRPVEEKKP